MKGGEGVNLRKTDCKAMDMANQARNARNAYYKAWRATNRERLKLYYKEWREKNPEKVKQYTETYWKKKAAQNGEAAAAEGR